MTTRANPILKWIITRSIDNSRLVVALALVLTALGVWSFVTLTTDAFPDLTPNQVLVMTEAPGFSQHEVEQQVTYPLETSMLGLPRTTGVRSISKVGLSVVTVTFEDNVDLYFARAQVQQRMQDAVAMLPLGTEPMLGPPATAMGEVFEYLVESTRPKADTAELIRLTNAQEYVIAPMLRTVPGVAEVNAWGGMQQQYQVSVDPNRLAGYGLTLEDVEKGLSANNDNFGGSYIETAGERFTVRGVGRVSDVREVADIVISSRQSTPIYVRDVATVAAVPQPRFGAVSRDGKGEALSATILMLKGSNGREVVARVEKQLAEINKVLPEGMHIRPFYNQGDVVKRTTHTVLRNLVEGAILVIVVLALFLGSVRASMITASVIPLSLLFAFIMMKRFGVSANLMSLGALDFGLIVDASVVMVENFIRRSSQDPSADQRSLIRGAAIEVSRPIVFGILIIVAVYIPIFALEGLEGRMFRPMAFTVCAAVLGSLLIALSYVPAVSAMALKAGRVGHHDPAWFQKLSARYDRSLAWSLRHRGRVMSTAGALLLLAFASVPFLGTEFMPKLDEGYLLIETLRAPSIALPDAIRVSNEVESTLLKFPEVASVVTNLGRPHEATETMALNQADVYVLFKPRNQWHAGSLDELIESMDASLAEIPGLTYEFSAPMRMRLDEVVSGVKTDLGIKIYGDSLPLLEAKAAAIENVVSRVPGAEGTSVGVSSGSQQLQIDVDRVALGRYGLSVADIREAVETGVGGSTATEVLVGRQRIPVVVRLDAPYRESAEDINAILIHTPADGVVTLSQVARVQSVEAPEVINHESGQRYIVVQSNVHGRDLGSFVSDVRAAVGKQVVLPAGYHMTYSGQFENQARATRRLSLILPLVLLLIGVLLRAGLGSVKPALLVMLNVPFAAVGGIAALWLRGLHINLSASVGFIALFGVAVLNGVVLITYILELRASGMELTDAIREGSRTRLRPVLMTALVASVGFIPMAISTSAGAEIQRPLATVVIGGLLTSTLLTLIVLPVVYGWADDLRIARSKRKTVVGGVA